MRFEALREVLLKGGIAPRHVRRYLAELSEHLDDLTAQQREAGYDAQDAAIRARARLGSDTELAHAMLEQKQFRSLAARIPWAVFGLLPPIAAVATFFALMGILALVAHACGMIVNHSIDAPPWFRQLVQAARDEAMTRIERGAAVFGVQVARVLRHRRIGGVGEQVRRRVLRIRQRVMGHEAQAMPGALLESQLHGVVVRAANRTGPDQVGGEKRKQLA